MFKRMTCLLITSIVLLFGATAFSASLPDYFPHKYRYMGPLQRLDTDRNEALIGGMRVKLAQPLRVYTTSTQFGTIKTLRVGMMVGTNDAGNDTVSEIWVLPKGSLSSTK